MFFSETDATTSKPLEREFPACSHALDRTFTAPQQISSFLYRQKCRHGAALLGHWARRVARLEWRDGQDGDLSKKKRQPERGAVGTGRRCPL
jgi:hypothetical protein